MNYALFLSKTNSYGVISTYFEPCITERYINGQWVTVFVAPQNFVDTFLKLNPEQKSYLKRRTHSLTEGQKKTAILAYFGHTDVCAYTDDDEDDDCTCEVIGKLLR